MVHRPADQGTRRARQDQASAARGGGRRHHNQQQELVLRLPCNKGKACRFKRSCFSEEEDAASSAMLLLACVVCAPSV